MIPLLIGLGVAYGILLVPFAFMGFISMVNGAPSWQVIPCVLLYPVVLPGMWMWQWVKDKRYERTSK